MGSVCDGGSNVASQARTAGAVASPIELLTVTTPGCVGVTWEPVADAVVAIIREGGVEPARDAFRNGAFQLFMRLAADDTAVVRARVTVTWALGYVLKVSGVAGAAEARKAGCV